MAEPFLLVPAYRCGGMTPWGGSGLKTLFDKPIPDEHTGESLEMSVIPGLQSRTEEGTELSTVLARDPAGYLGAYAGKPFPLLLKLIDAREDLSVQVHPDDAYAAAQEGKLGKTEAWVILQSQPGARLVLGTQPGVTVQCLAQACQAGGKALEQCLRTVPVQAGDVYYIPSGMLHAIGGGIVLYEIQQSSDITYRFYDWDRRDASGRGRPLHIRQGLDVVRPDLDIQKAVPQVEHLPAGQRQVLLRTPYFWLDRYAQCTGQPLLRDGADCFGVLTALAPLAVRWADCALALQPGQSLFVPAHCPEIRLEGDNCLVAWAGALQEKREE